MSSGLWPQQSAYPSWCPQSTQDEGSIKHRAGHPSRYQDHKVWRLWNPLQHILTFQYFTDKGNEPKNYRPPALGEWKMKGCFPSNVMPDSWLNSHQCQAFSEGQHRPPPLLTTKCHGAPQTREICPSTGCRTARGKQVLRACGFLGSWMLNAACALAAGELKRNHGIGID